MMLKQSCLTLAASLIFFASPRQQAAIILSDTFSYSDGSLTNVSNLKWVNHSGTGTVDVTGGKTILT